MPEPSNDLYARVRRPQERPKPQRHRLRFVLAGACLVVLAAVVGFFVWQLGYRSRHFAFVSALSASTTNAYGQDSLTARFDGREFHVDRENAHNLYAYLTADVGQEPWFPPKDNPDLVLDYGDGSTLQMWQDTAAWDGHSQLYVLHTDPEGTERGCLLRRHSLELIVYRFLDPETAGQ